MHDPNAMSRDELLAAYYELQGANAQLQKDVEEALALAAQKESREAELQAAIEALRQKSAPTSPVSSMTPEAVAALERRVTIAEQRRNNVKRQLSAANEENVRLQRRISSHRCAIPNLQLIEEYSCGCVWVVDTRQCDGSLDLEFDTKLIPTCIHEIPPIHSRRVQVQNSVRKSSKYTLAGLPTNQRSGRRRTKA